MLFHSKNKSTHFICSSVHQLFWGSKHSSLAASSTLFGSGSATEMDTKEGDSEESVDCLVALCSPLTGHSRWHFWSHVVKVNCLSLDFTHGWQFHFYLRSSFRTVDSDIYLTVQISLGEYVCVCKSLNMCVCCYLYGMMTIPLVKE